MIAMKCSSEKITLQRERDTDKFINQLRAVLSPQWPRELLTVVAGRETEADQIGEKPRPAATVQRYKILWYLACPVRGVTKRRPFATSIGVYSLQQNTLNHKMRYELH